MSDPTMPGWRPGYTGADLGNIGSGERLGVHLYYLYRAGRNELPETAQVYAGLTGSVHKAAGPMKELFTLSGRGMERSHERLLELRAEVHDVFRQTALVMQEAGAALVEIARAYAATDQAAVDAMTRLLGEDADSYAGLPPHVPPMAGTTDLPPTPPHDHGRPN